MRDWNARPPSPPAVTRPCLQFLNLRGDPRKGRVVDVDPLVSGRDGDEIQAQDIGIVKHRQAHHGGHGASSGTDQDRPIPVSRLLR